MKRGKSNFAIVFPPLPIMPKYDLVQGYSREMLQAYAQHVAKIMIKHAIEHMVPVKRMDDFPPPPMLPETNL